MASLKEHCEDCRRELGEDFKHVHEWLDALFKVLGPKHRSARHHAGGVEEVRKMWGDRAARAAEIHICKDYGGRVPTANEVQLWSLCGPPKVRPMLNLVRHAESCANIGTISADYAAIPLTEQGHKQAAELARSFPYTPDWIGVSTYLRARQTAKPLQARFPHVPVYEMPVHEFTYISPSRCTERSLAELKPHVDAYWDKLDPDHNDGEGAESFVDLLSRAKAFLADAATRPGVGVVFTHAQFIRAIQVLLSAPPVCTKASLMQVFFQMRKTTPVPNTSVTQLQFTHAGWTVLR